MHAGLTGGNWLSYTSISLAGSPHVVFPHSKMEPRTAFRPMDASQVPCVGQGSLRNGLAEALH